jgi:hypothetical protein
MIQSPGQQLHGHFGVWAMQSDTNTVLEFMRETEAREWLQRYEKKVLELGRGDARQWWLDTIEKIEKIRGKKEADNLRQRMTKIRDSK